MSLLWMHSEAIKQQIRFTKQESLSTTRNAIRTAREAEETAQNTLSKLGQQTGTLAGSFCAKRSSSTSDWFFFMHL